MSKGHTFYGEEAEVAESLINNIHGKPDLSKKMCQIVIEQKRMFGGVSLAILNACAIQLDISCEALLNEMLTQKNDLSSDLPLQINLSAERAQFLADSYKEINRKPTESELSFFEPKFVLMALMTRSFHFGQLIFNVVDEHASEETKQSLDMRAEELVKEKVEEQVKENSP